jgi:hypothetical protein
MNKVKRASRHLGPAAITVAGIVVLVFSLLVSTPSAPLNAASEATGAPGAEVPPDPVVSDAAFRSMSGAATDRPLEGRGSEEVE